MQVELEKAMDRMYCVMYIRLGLGRISDKKKGLPSPRAEAGQENIETVHEPKPIQTEDSL